jgi:hypothetical protein
VQIAQALQEAHESGIIHRDLKPANVIITPRGQSKVLDFGIAKLLAPDSDATVMTEADVLIGTPKYMSPEQAEGRELDERSDLWSLGVVYYEMLTGRPPFQGRSTVTLLHAITHEAYEPVLALRPQAPAVVDRIIGNTLSKNPGKRYTSAAAFVDAASELLIELSGMILKERAESRSRSRWLVAALVAVVCVAVGAGYWFYHHTKMVRWAREDAPAQIGTLQDEKKSLAAYLVMKKAEGYLPADDPLHSLAADATTKVSVTSDPVGATVQIQDYLLPSGPWYSLGVTPIRDAVIPKGYFRWKISKAGTGEQLVAPDTRAAMHFSLARATDVPAGMVAVPAETWENSIGFIGWLGPYNLPAYYVDLLEVTNADYQRFVDSGGYQNRRFWTEPFTSNGKTMTWEDAMATFRDSTGRAGPSTWAGGHYPAGQADFPVTGVSWFEASAYAAFVGKQLPVAAQWFQNAPPWRSGYIVLESNMASSGMARGGAYQGIGPYGTYDTAGNAREWTANEVDGGLRFILGGSWKSPNYLFYSPEALSPFDRSDTNGFRCVKNPTPLPDAALQPVKRAQRDFASFHTVSNDVFHAYTLLYSYPETAPLQATDDGLIEETADWTEQKVTYDAGYDGQRMSAYLFLPKHVKPPYQAVLFFPSARVLLLPDAHSSRVLGDVKFFDYILQSGRAVMYPVYEGTYERRFRETYPGEGVGITEQTHHYKDAARSVDYLNTRKDIDSSKLAYLGVSMGAAEGVIITSLLQDRLQTAILLDGGYFLNKAPAGGDAADFAVRMKKPVLMVNGRYDFTFPLEKSQKPLFDMFGTPVNEKRHVVLNTPHDVTEERANLVREVLGWLDSHLGRVGY